jgi:hypothetical protein
VLAEFIRAVRDQNCWPVSPHTLLNGVQFPPSELSEVVRLYLEGARQAIAISDAGVAGRRFGIGMSQHIAALGILPVRCFLQHQVLKEWSRSSRTCSRFYENGLTAGLAQSAGRHWHLLPGPRRPPAAGAPDPERGKPAAR